MTIQTLHFYSNSDGSTASLVWDDVSMTASGVLVHVPQGAGTVRVNATIGGQQVNLSYPAGTDTTYTFVSPLPVSFITSSRGQQILSMPWLESVAIAVDG